jgi:hypothetical protein
LADANRYLRIAGSDVPLLNAEALTVWESSLPGLKRANNPVQSGLRSRNLLKVLLLLRDAAPKNSPAQFPQFFFTIRASKNASGRGFPDPTP